MLVNNNNNNIYNSPSFDAIKIKLKDSKKFSDYRLVKINMHNVYDVIALDKADYAWAAEKYKLANESNYYLRDIFTSAVTAYKDDKHQSDDIQIFALTKQRFFFPLLNYKKIVAAAQMSIKENEAPTLEYLQVRPQYQYANKKRTTKGIGTYFLDSLKTVFNGKRIYLSPDGFSSEFYKKYNKNFSDTECYI